jgi:hypothetical protein
MKLNERGEFNTLLIPLILATLFFFGALGFGVWAYMERQDYKENSDKKAQAAVTVAVDKAKSEKDNEFVQKEKYPLRDYSGPVALGSISFKYPKTWSGYFIEKATESTLIMHPKLVSGDEKSAYALKVEVVSGAYDKVLASMENNVKSGKLSASAFRLEKLQEVLGTRLDGEIASGKTGSMILLPLRDKTIKISTEAEDYQEDFDNIILKDFTFSP